jgi:hypothetical protein
MEVTMNKATGQPSMNALREVIDLWVEAGSNLTPLKAF